MKIKSRKKKPWKNHSVLGKYYYLKKNQKNREENTEIKSEKHLQIH